MRVRPPATASAAMPRPQSGSTIVSFQVCRWYMNVMPPSAIASASVAANRCSVIPRMARTAMTETMPVVMAIPAPRPPRSRIAKMAVSKHAIATSSSACAGYHIDWTSISWSWETLDPVPLSAG